MNVKPKELAEALKSLIQIKQPAFVHGSPGCGKSDIIKQVADSLDGYEFRDVRCILLDPCDLRGLPVAENGKAKWLVPDFLPTKGKGVLLLDELNSAPQLVQGACYQLILNRKLGEYTLPPGWAVIAAGNKEGDRGVVTRMPTPLANRFTHFTLDADLDDWSEYAIEKGFDTRVIAFIRFRPSLLFNFDPKRDEKAFATPRSWEFVSRILASGLTGNPLYASIAGTVGEGAAVEFLAFCKMYDSLPDLDDIIAHPDVIAVPKEPASCYAVAIGLSRKADPKNFSNIITYLNHMPVEFSVLAVTSAVGRNPKLKETVGFVKWAAKNSTVLL